MATAHGRQAQRHGADGSAHLREGDVDADGAEQGALAGHVGAGDEQEGARRADGNVVADAEVGRQQRMAERDTGDLWRFALDDLGPGPVGILEGEGAECGERLGLGEPFEPAPHVGTGDALPAL